MRLSPLLVLEEWERCIGRGTRGSGSVPEWITFTPDSAVVYISNSGAASLSPIDARAMKLIAVIPVGEVPKRIKTLTLP
jgi:YVTN family beta-propeller protein